MKKKKWRHPWRDNLLVMYYMARLEKSPTTWARNQLKRMRENIAMTESFCNSGVKFKYMASGIPLPTGSGAQMTFSGWRKIGGKTEPELRQRESGNVFCEAQVSRNYHADGGISKLRQDSY